MESLERDLIFTEKHELAEYVHENLLNKELYKAYLANKDNNYTWKHTPVDTFNEVYYQCTRVYNDPNPESDIYNNYLNDARDNLGTRYASDMIFSMVNAIFLIMDNRPENVEFFQAELQAKLKDEQHYFEQYAKFAQNFIKTYGRQTLNFPISPVSPRRLSWWDWKSWKKCTDDFDEFYIRKYVNRYTKLEDQLSVIDIIEKAYCEAEANIPVVCDLSGVELPF